MFINKLIKGTLTALVIAAIITACDFAVVMTRPTQPTNFEYVCQRVGEEFNRIEEINCRLLDEPIVVESKLLRGFPWYGVYAWDEPYVFIQPNLPDELRTTTLQHEMAHYVVHRLKLVPRTDTCEHERIARAISKSDLDDWDAAAKRNYGCPVGE